MRFKPSGFAVAVLLSLLVSGAVVAQPPAGEASGNSAEGSAQLEPAVLPFDLAEVVARSSAGINSWGKRIDIAVTDANEYRPSVAHCASDQYLVVYEYDDRSDTIPSAIYGQRLTSGGSLLGAPFRINTDEENMAGYPDVACEWSQNRFVVVWEYDFLGDYSDYDVRGQLVHGAHQTNGPQLVGSRFAISQQSTFERQPAVACNSDDATCLVVFSYRQASGISDIHGQRLGITTGDPYQDGDPFVVSDPDEASADPDVAWGSVDENYLVVWQQEMPTVPSVPAYFKIVFTHVHDTEQGAGADELLHGPAWLIEPGTWDTDQTNPSVAYNHWCSHVGRYLVAFSYWQELSDDIGARRVSGTAAGTEGPPFLVESTELDAYDSRVAPNGELDQFLVTYLARHHGGTHWDSFVYGQRVQGTHNFGTGGQLWGSAVEIYAQTKSGVWLSGADVTGSPYSAGYLTAWGDADLDCNYDTYGQLLEFHSAYLPCLVRNH